MCKERGRKEGKRKGTRKEKGREGMTKGGLWKDGREGMGWVKGMERKERGIEGEGGNGGRRKDGRRKGIKTGKKENK